MNINDNNDLYSTKEGFLRGNMFKDEYMPYKNLTYINIKPSNDREAKLWTISQYSFAINDLNLYLDIHPENNMMVQKLEKLIKEEKQAKEEYIKYYGPLDICDVSNTFEWINNPWPWEGMGDSSYV
jgi:hypothetical protein